MLCLLFKWDENISNFQDFYKMDKIYTSIFPELAVHILNFCCPEHVDDIAAVALDYYLGNYLVVQYFVAEQLVPRVEAPLLNPPPPFT